MLFSHLDLTCLAPESKGMPLTLFTVQLVLNLWSQNVSQTVNHTCRVNGPIIYIHEGHVLYAPNKWGFISELLLFNMETNTWRLESPHCMKHPGPTQLDAVCAQVLLFKFVKLTRSVIQSMSNNNTLI